MRLAVICFSKRGAAICRKLSLAINSEQYHSEQYHSEQYCCELASTNDYEGFAIVKDLSAWTENAFSNAHGIVFVGACGIAVRCIAPFLKNKTQDPAVVVIDDMGKFAIPILSGHIGGANDLAREIASIFTDMLAVITTASDGQKLLAIDSFAVKNKIAIDDMQMAKAISAAFLDKEEVGFQCQFPYFHLPPALTAKNRASLGISISIYENDKPFAKTLLLIPPVLHLGIGCKKNTTMEAIEDLLHTILLEKRISINSIKNVASIVQKAEEQALLALCKKYNWTFSTYSAKELNALQGSFTSSAFVKQKMGVDNVCERAALLSASADGILLQTKISKNGVTLALAMEKWSVDFAE